jgi:DNA polymerase-3 subunit beta
VKLLLSQKDLAAAAKAAARQVPARPLPPILAGLLLEAAEDRLTVSGFDFEASASSTIPAEVLEPGRIVVPGRLLADIAGMLPSGAVELTLDGSEAVLECGGARFALALLPVADYPRLPSLPVPSGTVPGDLLAAALSHAAGAVADPKDATGSLAGMAGVNLRSDGRTLVVTATDRYSVVEHRLPWDPSGPAAAVTVSPRMLVDAARSAAAGDVELALPADGVSAAVSGSGAQSVLRVLADPFPATVDRLWPTELAATVEVDADELLAAVKRVSLVAEEKTPLLVEAVADGLTIAAATGMAARGRERIEAVLEGPEVFRIAFQPQRLITALLPLSGTVQIGLVAPTRPAVVQSLDTPDCYRALVMPVRHPWVTELNLPAAA